MHNVYIYIFRFLPKSKSFSDDCMEVGDMPSALDVVRTKRAKQQLAEKVIKVPPRVGQPARSESRAGQTPHHEPRGLGQTSRSESRLGQTLTAEVPASPHAHPAHAMSPEVSLPPPPSPPCTCGKVLGDMGPPPPPDHHWDAQSIDSHVTAESKGTIESRRSQGYVSMTSASTYLIDATGADPVLLPADMYHYGQPGYQPPPPTSGYPPPPPGPAYSAYPGQDMSRLEGDGHCNHLNDDCDCFKEDYSIKRKVSQRLHFLLTF